MGWLKTIWHFCYSTLVIVEFEGRKLFHQPSEIVFRSIQPILWLLMFGQVISGQLSNAYSMPYIDFITPGILAQSVLFIAIFNGIAVIWERDMGIVQKLMVAPVSRAAIVLGKGLGSGLRAISQLIIIYILAVCLGVKVDWSVAAIVGVTFFVVLGAVLFSTFSLVIACIVKTRERFMGIGQLLTMPLFFASNAIYPVSAMPNWLMHMAHVNPLTFEVDSLRTLMLQNFNSDYGLGIDGLYMLLVTVVLVVIGTILYPRLAN